MGNKNCFNNASFIICDVPQEKGASRKIPKLFWDTCGGFQESCGKSCGKSCRDLQESWRVLVGKSGKKLWGVAGSSGIREMKGKQNLQGEIVLAG